VGWGGLEWWIFYCVPDWKWHPNGINPIGTKNASYQLPIG
jgi:hypothetical protein